MSYDPNNPKKLTPEEIVEMRKYLDDLVDGGAGVKHLFKSNTNALLQHLSDQQRRIVTLEAQLAATQEATQ